MDNHNFVSHIDYDQEMKRLLAERLSIRNEALKLKLLVEGKKFDDERRVHENSVRYFQRQREEHSEEQSRLNEINMRLNNEVECLKALIERIRCRRRLKKRIMGFFGIFGGKK